MKKLSIGIVGLPNVGKSTLFKLLTKQDIVIANYPFATIDPNVGIVSVPDERLQKLTKLSNSKKTVPAVVEFYDIAGLVKGANVGEGLGNQFLSHIRDVSAIVHLVRIFKDSTIIHVEGETNPLRDLEIIHTELQLKDLDTTEKAFAKAEADARGGKKEFVEKRDLIAEIKGKLTEGKMISSDPATIKKCEPVLKELNLLTSKPELFLLNGEKSDVPEELTKALEAMSASYLVMDLSKENKLDSLIKKAYEVLNLISFFTTGEDETRAWTISSGAKAPEAAGVIHTDFEEKFIRAEVIACDKLIEAGGWAIAKQKGWLRIEGKDYLMQDGDVVVVRHG